MRMRPKSTQVFGAVVTEGERMGEAEKRVLRRRKPAIVETVQFTPGLVKELLTTGLIDRDLKRQLELERREHSKMSKIVDHIIATESSEGFSELCVILRKDYAWLSKDLEADLRAEKGDFIIDDDITKEIGMLVHRKFGSSKRFSEGEKREIQDLIALKLQIAKEEWLRQLDLVKTDTKVEKYISETRDKKIRKLSKVLKDFVKTHETQLTTHAHGLITTTKALQISTEECTKDDITKLEENFTKLLGRISKVLTHRDLLLDEREKCCSALGIQDSSIALSTVLPSRLRHPNVCDSNMENGQVDEKTKRITRLKKTVINLEHEVTEKEETIQTLQSELEERETEVARLRQEMKLIQERSNEEAPSVAANLRAKQTYTTSSADSTRRVAPYKHIRY